ncbi:MAG: hypothetical protein JWM11_958 [Planctomycetaceae bacterium]|nr:hypothetical protein [Planctomycetaceae bacterium]
MTTDFNGMNSGDVTTTATTSPESKPGLLTAILIVSLIICVGLTVGFKQLGSHYMDLSISEVDEDGFIVVKDQLFRIGNLFCFVAIFFSAPSGLFGFMLGYNLATKSATDRRLRLESFGKAFWVMLAIACIPIVLMSYDVMTNLQNGANRAAVRDRMWIYLYSGISLVTLSLVPYALERRRFLKVQAVSKKPTAE